MPAWDHFHATVFSMLPVEAWPMTHNMPQGNGLTPGGARAGGERTQLRGRVWAPVCKWCQLIWSQDPAQVAPVMFDLKRCWLFDYLSLRVYRCYIYIGVYTPWGCINERCYATRLHAHHVTAGCPNQQKTIIRHIMVCVKLEAVLRKAEVLSSGK